MRCVAVRYDVENQKVIMSCLQWSAEEVRWVPREQEWRWHMLGVDEVGELKIDGIDYAAH